MSATRFSAFRIRSAALAAALALTATACGGSDSSSDTTTATTDTMTESTTGTSTASSDVMTDDTMTEGTMTDGTAAPGTETTAGHSGDAMIDGSTLWTSPDGKTSMEIDPTWTDGGAPGLWTIGTSGANVIVVDQPGVDVGVQEYLDTAVSQLPQLGTFNVIDSGVRKGPHGDIGYVEYSGEATAAAGIEVHVMQTISVANGHASVGTFSTMEADFASMSESVVPYLETIQAL